MVRIVKYLIAALMALALVGCANYQTKSMGAPAKMAGGVLVNSAGMTLYTFDKDVAGSGKSTCNGPCAALWPPIAAEDGTSGSGDYSIVSRDDGTKQWAYQGKPIYLYAKDEKPGDMKGDNVKNVWHVIK